MQNAFQLFIRYLYVVLAAICAAGCAEEKLLSNTEHTVQQELPALKIEASEEDLKIRIKLTLPPALEFTTSHPVIIESNAGKKVTRINQSQKFVLTELGNSQIKIGNQGIFDLPVKFICQLEGHYFQLGGHRYAGDLCIYKHDSSGLQIINEISLEKYVASVVDSEMPISFGLEARKAQAIVARTYGLTHILAHRPYQNYDLTDTVRHQKYHSVAYQTADGRWLSATTKEAVKITESTRNLVCAYKGQPFVTYYCACCGGHTFDLDEIFNSQQADIPGHKDPWCQESPNLNWSIQIPRDEAIRLMFEFINQKSTIAGKKQFANFSGMSRVPPANEDKLPSWSIRDGINTQILTALDLKQCWAKHQLPSPRFTINITNEEFVIKGHGAGHGVGLCQWGAKGMSSAGKSAEEIISFYFQNSVISDWKKLDLKIPGVK